MSTWEVIFVGRKIGAIGITQSDESIICDGCDTRIESPAPMNFHHGDAYCEDCWKKRETDQ